MKIIGEKLETIQKRTEAAEISEESLIEAPRESLNVNAE